MTKKIVVYELESENLTHLGGPMGTEYTYPNWRKHFRSVKEAKECAEKEYNGSRGKIEWIKEKYKIRSQDLGYVMYHIRKIEV